MLTKFTIVLAFLLSAASLGGNWYLYQTLLLERSEHDAQREELDSQQALLREQNTNLESQVTQFKQEAERLRTQVRDYVNQRDAVKKELERARQEAGELQKQLRQLTAEKTELGEQLSVGEITEKAIVQEVAKQPVASPTAPVAAAALPAPKEAELPKKTAPAAPPVLEDTRPDQVLSVNRQFNFVVINMGIQDRLKIGDTLRVEQSGKLVGQVRVEKLYENFSACTILEEAKPAQIKEGDLVRLA